MTETNLLPCPFCGGEAKVTCAGRGGYQTQVGCTQCNCRLHEWFRSKAKAIEAWNTRATHGTLTAEQVREAVMSADRWEKPMGNTGLTNTHLIIRDDAWQAIADELNATLGSGECKDSGRRFNAWQCSVCGMTLLLMFDDYGEPSYSVDGIADVPHYCPGCGAKVVR